MNENIDFPELLKIYRVQNGYTQAQAAQALGYSKDTIASWENGRRYPDNGEIPRLAGLLEVDAQRLARSINARRAEAYILSLREGVPAQDTESDKDVNRREAIKAVLEELGIVVAGSTLLATPEELLDSLPARPFSRMLAKPASIDGNTLSNFEKLTRICWDLTKGNELETVWRLLPTFVPRMELLAKQTSQYQGKAASVAAQGYFLAGIVALHQNNISAMEAYRKQGVVYAQLSGDQNLHVAALMHLACAYYYNKRPLEALETFQNALLYIDQASSLVRGCVYARMAKVHAQCGQEQPARRCLGLAQEAFSLHTVDDPFALFADGGHYTLFLWEGLTLLELDEPRHAQEVLALMATLPSQIAVPRRTLAEATNHQAEAAIASGNKELFIPLIKAGARGASELCSEKRRLEAWDLYGQARRVWSNDAQIKNLREELLSYQESYLPSGTSSSAKIFI